MEQPQDALSAVVAAFETWRNHRPSRSAKTPAHLRRQAVDLRADYGYSHVTTALRISGRQYSQWLQEFALEGDLGRTSFVALPAAAPVRASLHHPSGSRLDLHELNEVQLSQVVRCLLGAA